MGKRQEYLIGQVLGECVYLNDAPSNNANRSALFQCKCGKQFICKVNAIKTKHTVSCGCSRIETHKSLEKRYTSGDILGRNCVYLFDINGDRRPRRAMFLCRCGKEFESAITYVKTGSVSSCGCVGAMFQKVGKITHGMIKTPEYRAWAALKNRCCNKKGQDYHHYGGRGIYVSKEWLESFDNFYNDMGCRPGPKYSVERKDYNGPYSKENCIWADIITQQNNKRNNRNLNYNNNTQTIAQWSRQIGIARGTIQSRLDKKLPINMVLRKRRVNKQEKKALIDGTI